jgi:hypothetical protein
MSLNFLATRFTCSWPWDILVMLCDGRMVCGCADPYGKRVLGDARTASVNAIWGGETLTKLRGEINGGGSKFCGDCPLKLPLKKDQQPPDRGPDAGPLPRRLFIECTAACNISCNQACCAPETGITRTRQAGMLDFDVFKRVIDETGHQLVRIDFFNYGETFLHKRAIEMCEYIKSNFPHVYLYTSTNGLAFNEDGVRRLMRSRIDEVTFSIDGATPETYALYRQRGDFHKAIRNLAAAVDEKRKTGADVPQLNWRYILFAHNDSDEEMNLARKMAAGIGVDRLSWEITDHPENMFSRRFVPGSEDFRRIEREIWDNNYLGNAIPGATPRAQIDVRTLLPGVPLIARPGKTVTVKTRVKNLSTRPFPAKNSSGRRLVRLGAQLCGPDRTLIELNHARALLPVDVAPQSEVEVPIEIAAPEKPGKYMLKFDLVSEGVDWFENCGSPVTYKTLRVI